MRAEVWLEDVVGKDHLEDLDIDLSTILKWVLVK
jgi:hypothetical protein